MDDGEAGSGTGEEKERVGLDKLNNKNNEG